MTILQLKSKLTNREFQAVLHQVFTGQKTAKQVKKEYGQ